MVTFRWDVASLLDTTLGLLHIYNIVEVLFTLLGIQTSSTNIHSKDQWSIKSLTNVAAIKEKDFTACYATW